jgi:hypothetical protein
MIWGALIGGLIGAGIPGFLTYLGLRRARQSTDAEAFGPALLLLYRLQPDRVMMNLSSDAAAEAARVTELAQQTDRARERLLVVSAGHPRRHVRELARMAEVKLGNVHHLMGWQVMDMYRHRDNPEWEAHYRNEHAEAQTAMDDLIAANFAWRLPRLKKWVTALVGQLKKWVPALEGQTHPAPRHHR